MEEIAQDLGFEFLRKGCPCSGTPRIYAATKDGTPYRLTIFPKRDFWALERRNVELCKGSSADMKTKIEQIWLS